MSDEAVSCREEILSEDYLDLIYTAKLDYNPILESYGPFCKERVSYAYSVIHLNRSKVPDYSISAYGYDAIPALYTLLDNSTLDAAGISPLLIQPSPNLRGQEVLIGFLDTGIDYRNTVFRQNDGKTRIAAIWDQTIQSEHSPEGFFYGTEYTREDIDEALREAAPTDRVPTSDENGHGTFLASLAAGSESSDGSFSGAAPEAEILAVKLKPAKQNLKEYYLTDAEDVYQETDLMFGIRYLFAKAEELRKPLVICIGLGTNQGAHDGTTVLETILDWISVQSGVIPVMAGGNEGGLAHHFLGTFPEGETMREAELRIPEGEDGFRLELWGDTAEVYTLSFVSPGGEVVPRIPARQGQSQILTFLLDPTRITVDYTLTAFLSGNLLISVGIRNPSPGIWTLRVYRNSDSNGNFHIWLPAEGLADPETVFLRPDPDTTLTSPGNARSGVTVVSWDMKNGSIDVSSSRGYTRDGRIRPDFAAPGVNVGGILPGGKSAIQSGSSVSAAITAGAVADLLTWGVTNRNMPVMDSQIIRAYLIRGASRKNVYTYPNREWGYGTLNLAGVFENMKVL